MGNRQAGQTSVDEVKKKNLRAELLIAEMEAKNKKRKAEGLPPLPIEGEGGAVGAIADVPADDEANKRRKLLQDALEMDKDDSESEDEKKDKGKEKAKAKSEDRMDEDDDRYGVAVFSSFPMPWGFHAHFVVPVSCKLLTVTTLRKIRTTKKTTPMNCSRNSNESSENAPPRKNGWRKSKTHRPLLPANRKLRRGILC